MVGWEVLNGDVKEKIFSKLTLVQLSRAARTCREFHGLFRARCDPLTADLLAAGRDAYGGPVLAAVALAINRFTAGLEPFPGVAALPAGVTGGTHGAHWPLMNEHSVFIDAAGVVWRGSDWPEGSKVDASWTPGKELRFLFIFADEREETLCSWRSLLALRVHPVGFARQAYALDALSNEHCIDVLGGILGVCLELQEFVRAFPSVGPGHGIESLRYRLPMWAYDSPHEHDSLLAAVAPLSRMFDVWKTEVETDELTTSARWTLTGARTRVQDWGPLTAACMRGCLAEVGGFLSWARAWASTWVHESSLGLIVPSQVGHARGSSAVAVTVLILAAYFFTHNWGFAYLPSPSLC